ncbi:cysteinyl leukotriene receptor 1 isoform X2 [Takifugu flavidus]|uniref:cysteinyl leukotriene receptor 1 isoform X2 n=1 Tax=Takifugu flavidus TaxID=433684 RepID=UPI002544039E|nr:cysteinyl leukotriene receptor 1 isoform X2 [Takifugu flavidus]
MAHVNATNISQDHATVCPSIDDFRNQVYSTLYSVIIVLGLAGNGLALAALSRPRRQSSSFYIYLVNLAVSDLLCVMMLPLRVVYYVKKGQWDYGDVVCRLTSYSLYVNLYCSIYLMTAMSISRFLAIVFPMKNMQLVKVKCARRVCVCIWLFVCLSTSPFLMNGQHVDSSTNKTKCFEPPQGQGLHKLLVLNYLSLVLGFALPFLVILLCYAAIIWTLLSRKYTRTVHLSFLSRVDTTCAERTTMQKSVVVTLTLAAANSCLDPLLYFFSSKSFHTCSSSTRQSWTDCTKQTT